MFGSQDISAFFADGSDAVLDSGETDKVHLNFPEQLENFTGLSRGGTELPKPSVEYATGSALGKKMAHGVGLKIDGQHFTVNNTRQVDDGLTSVADLNLG